MEPPASSFIETAPVDLVLSLDAVKDKMGAELALLTVLLESGNTVRIPLPVTAAMRVWALLDQARQDKGWPMPTCPVSSDEIQ